MKKPSVLIVGAGAMGMVNGYYLNLAGAQISFLVRPGRRAVFSAPQTLYCYDDGELKTFDGYRVIEAIADADAAALDYVLITLDGASSRSASGTAMLKEVGAAILPGSATLIMGGVGIGLREHYLQSTGLPPSRVLNGILGVLCHQVSADLTAHTSTDSGKLAKAALAYRHFSHRTSLMLESTNPASARRFAALYNRNGLSRCIVINERLSSAMTNSVFPMLAASQIAGWPSVDGLVHNRELWHLACRAQNEIAALPRHGWIGKLFSMLMTDRLSAMLHRKLEKDALPLSYQAFNRYHHGGKVHEQDVEIMRNCLIEGQHQGLGMPALKELLDRLAAFKATHAA